MTLRSLRIGAGDRDGQEAFFRFVPRVFPSLDFRRWRDRGGWTESYRAFALADGDEIVANVSVMRMDLVVDARPALGAQLGAVGVVPERRGLGLQRRLMDEVLEAIGPEAEMVFLYANGDVVDFYPRFGFERVAETIFGVETDVAPSGDPLPRLALDSAADLALFREAGATSAPVTERFGARGYGPVALWHATYVNGNDLFQVPEHDAVVVARQKDERLEVLDVFAPRRFELAPALPRIAVSRVRRIEFGFAPESWWPAARPLRPDADSPLFVRGKGRRPAGALRFPVLART